MLRLLLVLVQCRVCCCPEPSRPPPGCCTIRPQALSLVLVLVLVLRLVLELRLELRLLWLLHDTPSPGRWPARSAAAPVRVHWCSDTPPGPICDLTRNRTGAGRLCWRAALAPGGPPPCASQAQSDPVWAARRIIVGGLPISVW
jgi:hypothetical protein